MRHVTVTLSTLFLLLASLAFAQDKGTVGTISAGSGSGNTVRVTNLVGRGSGKITTGTICTCTLVVEGLTWSETTWKTIANAPALEASNTSYAFDASGYSAIRVRASAFTSGSTTIAIGISSAGGGTGGGSTGSGGDGAITDGSSSSIKATVFDFASANALAFVPVDGNGIPFSAASEVTLGAVSTNTGLLVERFDVLIDRIQVADQRGNPATPYGTQFFAGCDDTTPAGISEDTVGPLRMSCNQHLLTMIGDGAGNERRALVTAGNELLTELGAGTAYAGQFGLAGIATGGCTPFSLLSANTVNETQVKGTAGQLYWLNVTNIGASPVYFKLYNDTSANTDENDTPTLRLTVPGSATGAGNQASIPTGVAFSQAITYRMTTGIADNSTGAVAANEILVSGCYF